MKAVIQRVSSARVVIRPPLPPAKEEGLGVGGPELPLSFPPERGAGDATGLGVANDQRCSGKVGIGLVVLVAAHRDDTEANAERMADKVRGLRIFNNADGKMNLALADVGGSVLAVSNFTIYGETSKNRRPSFIDSAPYAEGERLYDHFVASLRGLEVVVETGVFGAHMEVELVNDGPVTVILET